LREERRLRVLENRVLRRMFGPKGGGVTGAWRKLRNEEISDLYSTQYCSDDQIEKNEIGRAFNTCGEGTGAYRILVRKPEGRRPL
jgi:hypothetical protein